MRNDRRTAARRARDWLLVVFGSVFATLAVIILGGVAVGGVLQTALQVGLDNYAVPVGIAFAVLALGLGVAYVLLVPAGADRARP